MAEAFTRLQSPSLGNTAQDISGGIANFLSGMNKERRQRRQDALEEALLNLREMEAQGKLNALGAKTGQRWVLQPVEDEDGRTTLEWFLSPQLPAPGGISQPVDNTSTEAGLMNETPPGVTTGPQQPQQPAAAQPRPAQSPTHVSTGKHGRTSPFIMYGSTPRPEHLQAAQFAPGVAEGFIKVRDITRSNPAAAAEAATFLNGYQFSSDIPGIGNAIATAVRAAGAAGLTPAAQQYIQAFLRYAAARQFATGGKALTSTEIRTSVGQYTPALREAPEVTQQKLYSMGNDALVVVKSTNRAYPMIRQQLTALGFPDLGDFDPRTQMLSNQNIDVSALFPQGANTTRSKYGYDR